MMCALTAGWLQPWHLTLLGELLGVQPAGAETLQWLVVLPAVASPPGTLAPQQAEGERPAPCASHWHSLVALPPGPEWVPGMEAFVGGQREEVQFVNVEVPEVEPFGNEPFVEVELVEL